MPRVHNPRPAKKQRTTHRGGVFGDQREPEPGADAVTRSAASGSTTFPCLSFGLGRGDIAIYESTVYPGATEQDCVPVLEAGSGLKLNEDFFVGYSPKRINPGDKQHRLPNICKVTSGSTEKAADEIDALYKTIIAAGTHKAPSIQVAEAAKVIENTQRDLNIALVNELAILFNHLNIDTHDVLTAAGTKWNFLPFRPGLVGGHCIGVDPYYLTSAAQKLGYNPEIILAGRRINDDMGSMIGQKAVKLMVRQGFTVRNCSNIDPAIYVLDQFRCFSRARIRNHYRFDDDIVQGLCHNAGVFAISTDDFRYRGGVEILVAGEPAWLGRETGMVL
mgnify:CR=1 FL=1